MKIFRKKAPKPEVPPKQSILETWANTEGLKPRDSVCRKDNLDYLAGLLYTFHDLALNEVYQVVGTENRYKDGNRNLPRPFLEVTGGNLGKARRFCESYLLTRA